MQPQIKPSNSSASNIYMVRSTSLCTPVFTRQIIEDAVERGATTVNLGAVQFAPPSVINELKELRREHEITYINVPEKTDHILCSTTS